MQFTFNKENKKALSILLCFFMVIGIFAMVLARAEDENPKVTYEDTFIGGGYTHPAKFAEYEKSYIIDVYSGSGTIDWNKVAAAGIDGVMLRIGYTQWGKGERNTDSAFETNYQGAKAAGLKVGAYYFSQAKNMLTALAEASLVIETLGKKTLDLPVAMDLEYGVSSTGKNEGILYEANLSKSAFTNNINIFCNYIENNGYDAMVYLNMNIYNNKLNVGSLKHPVWLARYNTSIENVDNYSFVMWQFSSTAKIDGISGNTDVSVLYTKNGMIEEPTTTETTTSQEDVTNPGGEVVPSVPSAPDTEEDTTMSMILQIFKLFIDFIKSFATMIVSIFG